jgi:putative acetyltransferase
MFTVLQDDLSGQQTRDLIALHLAGMQSNSPPASVFALGLAGLTAPGVTVWAAHHAGRVASIGALKRLGEHQGEIKSMRTHPDYLRQGAGAAVLDRIIVEAQARGLQRLSLETGSGPAFEPALTLYRRRGFRNGQVFSDYTASPFNQFLHLDLA